MYFRRNGKFIRKTRHTGCFQGPGRSGFLQQFFVDAKRDGGYRPFLNIKPLSCITPESSFPNGIPQVNNTGFEFRILGSINRSKKMHIYICRYTKGTRNTSDFA